MCGDCMESSLIPAIVEAEYNHDPHVLELLDERLIVLFYLQETSNLVNGINTAIGVEGFSNSMDIVLCRGYEQNILNGFDSSLSKVIMSSFDREAITAYFKSRKELIADETWQGLLLEETFTTGKNWNDLVQDKARVIDSSLKTLQSYYDWWIKGKTDSEFEDKAVTDTDLDRFYLLFPVIYFSLIYLTKHSKDSRIIKDIALNKRYNMHSMHRHDLWLQRKAFAFCSREGGIGFISANLNKVRFELIYYALLKTDLTLHALQKLKTILAGETDHFGVWITLDEVLRLIDTMIQERT